MCYRATVVRVAAYSNNMLYPKENKETRTLMMACRNCVNEETADDSCVYRHEIVKKTE